MPDCAGPAICARIAWRCLSGYYGHSSKDIGLLLEIAATAVETHRRQIMDKLQLRTVAELTKYAVREGLTTLE